MFQQSFAAFRAEDRLIGHADHRRRQQRRLGGIADNPDMEAPNECPQVTDIGADNGTPGLNRLLEHER